MKKKWKGILFVFLIIVLVLGIWGGLYYKNNLMPNVKTEAKLFIPTGSNYAQVLDSIKPFLKNDQSFDKIARKENYSAFIKPGRYTLPEGFNNKQILEKLKFGKQDEIAIRIGNYTSIFQLAGRVSPFLECDSASLVQAIMESKLSQNLDTAAMIYWLIPNTYQFHWAISGKDFANRMNSEYEKFWTSGRLKKAEEQSMSSFEVTTLASIVQLESFKEEEQPKVAGLYLNRLRIGMKLDADPTVIFAMKLQNPNLKVQRVYYKNLRIPSLYNTYLYPGLPPGPICMPNPSAIDAVLNPEEHPYFYFVADPENPGFHLYAITLKEQEENAKKYRDWLNRNAIQ